MMRISTGSMEYSFDALVEEISSAIASVHEDTHGDSLQDLKNPTETVINASSTVMRLDYIRRQVMTIKEQVRAELSNEFTSTMDYHIKTQGDGDE